MIIFVIFISFIVGICLGIHIANQVWVDNAHRVYRKEYRGHLYKVIFADNFNGEGWRE